MCWAVLQDGVPTRAGMCKLVFDPCVIFLIFDRRQIVVIIESPGL